MGKQKPCGKKKQDHREPEIGMCIRTSGHQPSKPGRVLYIASALDSAEITAYAA
jgi:hypothetical protein